MVQNDRKQPTQQNERNFSFDWVDKGIKIHLSWDIPIPLVTLTLTDYVAMFCAQNKIPVFARDDLRRELEEFIARETERVVEEEASEALASFLTLPDDKVDNIAAKWANTFSKNFKEHGPQTPTKSGEKEKSFSDIFSAILHASDFSVVHRLLQKERELASDVQKLVRERDWETDRLKRQHEGIIESAIKELDETTKLEANTRASRHCEQIQMVEGNYQSQISSLMEAQKREYKSFVMNLQNQLSSASFQFEASDDVSDPSRSSEKGSESKRRLTAESVVVSGSMDESFTIYLGAQLKTMHNLRLSALDPIKLCRTGLSAAFEESTRLQMLLNLYTNRLNAVVLLVNRRPTYHSSFRTAFYRACEQSTELHFPSLDEQLESVEKDVLRANEFKKTLNENDRNGSFGVEEGVGTGDVYVTRHSNLSQVHVVFHLVIDDAIKTKEINSRHPCINGLRNIVRLCSRFGITNLSLPLLLIDTMTEEITIPWCMKRAELIYKCVKGFLMEGAALGGTSSSQSGANAQHYYTLQFLLPPEISNDVFTHMNDMLPQIYHLVNPVIG